MLKALLIEDDDLWRGKLQVMLDEIGIALLASTATVANTIAVLEKQKPDILIADILLENETIFKLFDYNTNYCNIPTLLITHSDKEVHFNLAAKIVKHMYIVKPIHKLTLRSAIDALFTTKANSIVPHLTIKGSKNERIKLPLIQIIYIEQKGNYCHIRTKSKEYVVKKSLTIVSNMLDSSFLQIHRGYYVNINFITGFGQNLETVKIANSIELPIGRINKEKVKQFLSNKAIEE